MAISLSDTNLNEDEKQLLQEINIMRSQPSVWAQYLRDNRLNNFLPNDSKKLKLGNNTVLTTKEGQSAVQEAIRVLEETTPLAPFINSFGMNQSARDVTNEVGPKGEFEADSIYRFDDYGQFEFEAVEISSWGTNDPKELLSRFLVCDGDSERTNRSYLLEPEYTHLGVAIREHNSPFKVMVIINFTKNFVGKQ